MAGKGRKAKKKDAPRIKGYLPVRLKIDCYDGGDDETFFYVKEHQQRSSSSSSTGNNNNADGDDDARNVLFVANAPVLPQTRIGTKRLLRSLLGRYGEVRRVTMIDAKKRTTTAGGSRAVVEGDAVDEGEEALLAWTTKFRSPSFLPKNATDGGATANEWLGKFAHVVFESGVEMKCCVESLEDLMAGGGGDASDLPGLVLDQVELQTLADDEHEYGSDDDGVVDEFRPSASGANTKKKSLTGVAAVAERYRAGVRELADRKALLDECNAVMERFEDAEEADRRDREAAANDGPDDDGFITVRYSSQVGSKRELEEGHVHDDGGGGGGVTAGMPPPRRKGHKQRSRKKKKGIGATELSDFYKFQTKVNRKKTLQELRERFEEDLARVQRMKEERRYKPF